MSQTDSINQPAGLRDLATYQEGAIVSRALIKTPNGSVTVFAFDKGQEISAHTVAFDALVFVLEGTAEIRVSGAAHTVSAGEVIRMPANEPHALRAVERFKMLLSMVKA